MSVARRQSLMTADEFLAWEESQEFRYEFDGFQPLAMRDGTRAHATVARNLAIAVGDRLRGKSCGFYGGDLKVETVPGGKYRSRMASSPARRARPVARPSAIQS